MLYYLFYGVRGVFLQPQKTTMKKFDFIKIGVLLSVFIIGVTTSYYILKPSPALPIINPANLNPAVVDSSLQGQGRGHITLDFKLLDQNGDTITQANLRGKIIITDFFFTTCPSICVDMSKNMERLQEAFKDDDRIILLSHTVMPKVDSVPVLKAYADLHNAIDGKWYFLTGPEEEISRLARMSYFVVKEEGTSFDEHEFIHTDNFVLVDRNRRLRGYYSGVSDLEVDKLITDMDILLNEMAGK